MISRVKTVAALIALALGAVGACSKSTRAGSETNWFGHCKSDADCSVGHCVCDVCTEECDADNHCPGGEVDSCRKNGSSAFTRVCRGTTPASCGLCLYGCGRGKACAGGFD